MNIPGWDDGWSEAVQAGGIAAALGWLIHKYGWKYVPKAISWIKRRLP